MGDQLDRPATEPLPGLSGPSLAETIRPGAIGETAAVTIHFDWSVFLGRLFEPDQKFALAMVATICIAIVAQLVGTVLGLITALCRLSRHWFLRWPAYAYVVIIRGTPVIVQIFFVYYGANLFFGFTVFPSSVSIFGWTFDGAILAGIAALGINEGGYIGEIIRAGIASVGSGQIRAAKSLGMRPRLTMRRIVLPQAVRVIVPPFGNEFNNTLKMTSLLYVIGVYEMFADAQIHYSESFRPAEYFGAVAIWYLLLTAIWSAAQGVIERKMAIPGATAMASPRKKWSQVSIRPWAQRLAAGWASHDR